MEEKKVTTIERDGLTLTFVKMNEEPGQYTVTVAGDVNDADYISETYSVGRKEFLESTLGSVLLLYEITGRHFEDLPKTMDFFGSEYFFLEWSEIPLGHDTYSPHSVGYVRVRYTEGNKVYEFNPKTVPTEERKEIVSKYLHYIGEMDDKEPDEEEIKEVIDEIYNN